MLKVTIVATGKLKKGPLFELSEEYLKRIKSAVILLEIESKHKDPASIQQDEEQKTLKALPEDAFVIALDERGQELKSLDFSKKVQNLQNAGHAHVYFVIGGADGLTDTLRKRANLLLSFGRQTWPHMLARIMLLEQIYRVQQILAGHPYHRE